MRAEDGEAVGRLRRGVRSAHLIENESRLIGPGLPKAVLWTELAISHGRGALLYDLDGNSYLDLMGAGGVNSIGHAHPAVTEAAAKQLGSFSVGSFPSAARLALLTELAEMLPAEYDAIQLYSGGTEAVEAALRLATSATGKTSFLSFWGGFHGKTMASAALTTNQRDETFPAPGGFFNTAYASATTNPLGMPVTDYERLCVTLAREVVTQNCPGRLAAVVIEPVQGRSGNVVPQSGFLAEMAALAAAEGALFISDESMTGLGRTGFSFGFQRTAGLRPDVLILGKALGGGYPITAVAARREVMEKGSFGNPSASSSSFGGFPVACAAAAAAVRVIRADELAENSARLGSRLLEQLRPELAKRPLVTDVRGLGLAVGVEIADRRCPDGVSAVERIFRDLVDRGLLVMLGGTTLRLYPPLNIADHELALAAEILTEVIVKTADCVQ